MYMYTCMYVDTYRYTNTCIYIYMAVDQNSVLSRAPPLLQAFVAAGCFKSRISCRYDGTYYLKVALCFAGFVAEGFVAKDPRLLQINVAKWPPKPVTNPTFLIGCHMYVYTYIHMLYVYRCTDTHISHAGIALRSRGLLHTQIEMVLLDRPAVTLN